MIDHNRIEEIKLLSKTKAMAAMKEYAAELGVVTKARTIDNMVSEMQAQLAKRAEAEAEVKLAAEPVEPIVESVAAPVAELMTEAEPAAISEPIVVSGTPTPYVKGVTIVPEAVTPFAGKSFVLYAKPTGIDNVDTCTFQWQFQPAGGNYADIAGATSQVLKVESAVEGSKGNYRCKVLEADGTETTAATPALLDQLVEIPAGFPDFNFYEPKFIEFYGRSFAPVNYKGIYRMQKVIDGVNPNTPTSTIHRRMDDYVECIPLLYLIANSTELVATDSRDGYRYIISGNTNKETPIKIIGRFNKND